MHRLLLLLLLIPISVFSQDSLSAKKGSFFMDVLTGPYLFVDHHDYKSVHLTGARLGYEFDSKIALTLEYLAGSQQDIYGEIGTTHTANGQISYFFVPQGDARFRPYLHLGGGFFEFKDFSKDVLGVAWNTGGGSEFNFTPIFKGFIEARYVNLGWLNLEGKNELGVLCGLRARF